MKPTQVITAAILTALLLSSRNSATAEESKKVRVGWIGLTCEASIFAAVENGYFKQEGLDVELIKCDWKTYKDSLALGSYDITQHLVMYFLKPLEQGLDVRFLGGVHTGCLRVQASAKGDITRPEQLKGKRIGIPGMGTPPFVFASRALKRFGIDASRDIQWRVFPAGELGLAIDKGEVDAVADSEPIGTMLLTSGKVRNVIDEAADAPYKDEYCCEVVANGKWLSKNPRAAAAATRAILKGAKWVHENPAAAAKMSVEKKYLASNPELNGIALSKLNYMPSVSRAESSVRTAADEMQKAGMLAPTTKPDELAKKAFMHLEGVTDEWIEKTEVQKVAGGDSLPSITAAKLAARSGGAIAKMSACCAMPLDN
jgi:NitT/TauT family transport system substrate-binding protein